jgi:Flp pilus assembly protein TadG
MVQPAVLVDTCIRTNHPVVQGRAEPSATSLGTIERGLLRGTMPPADGATMRATATAKRSRPTRSSGEDGAALVEFALVSVLLVVLLFGIINFGLLLSFKQDMTRAAAEGARAGAVAPTGVVIADAQGATQEAVKAFSDRFAANHCTTQGMTCTYTLGPCVTPAPSGPPAQQCVTVELTYDYEHHPFLPRLPLLAEILPKTVNAKSIARVNP